MTPERPYLFPPLVKREQRHRRILLIALAALILLGVSPVVGHHLIRSVDWLPASLEHVGVFCAIALHQLLAPVHGVFHILLFAGLTFATVERWRAAVRHGRLLRLLAVATPAPTSSVADAARRAGLDPTQVRIATGLPTPAFTAGWRSPLVYVAADLPGRLTPDELCAVLAHEAAHVRRRDPLRLFGLRFLSGVLFWMPALRRLADDLADEAEIAADDAAARAYALPLASAILRMAGDSLGAKSLDTAVGFQRSDLVERRIRRLAGEDAVVGTHISGRSLVGAAAALLLVWASGVMVLHPLVDGSEGHSSMVHCDHHDATPLSHLFCRGLHAKSRTPCPHEALAARERSTS